MTKKAEIIGLVRAALLPGVLLLGTAPALAETAAPCMQHSHDRADFVTAFQSDGWNLLSGEAAEAAMLGAAEVHMIGFSVDPEAVDAQDEIADLTDPATYDLFLGFGHAMAEMVGSETAVLAKDDMLAAVAVLQVEEDFSKISCIFIGADIPEVEEAVRDYEELFEEPLTGLFVLRSAFVMGEDVSGDMLYAILDRPEGAEAEPVAPISFNYSFRLPHSVSPETLAGLN